MNETILVVDDDASTLTLLNEFLTGIGYSTFIAIDGEQALKIIETISPDLVLMDAMMPNMDGFDATKQLKRRIDTTDVPVIFMTGLRETHYLLKGLESGGVDYVSKPLNLEALAARIQVHLTNAQHSKSAKLALDESHQSMIYLSKTGELIWINSLAQSVLNQLGLNEPWEHSHLKKDIVLWLSDNPLKGEEKHFHVDDQTLTVKFLGEQYTQEYLFSLSIDQTKAGKAALQNAFALTARESEILLWIAQGKSNAEVALILDLSPRTVNKHLESVYRKLGVDNRTSAATLCFKYLH
ncbi:MAG: DNA-binding response regulator [Pseudomonadota bacterium]|nr:DNA-binding response regulator [Pseudomonadota bacterium]